MRLARFLGELFEYGHVRLDAADAPLSEGELQQASPILAAREEIVAADFPFPKPNFDPRAAGWAASQFYAACRFVLYREATAETINAALSEPCPAGELAPRHYSVDLVWRYLPDLDRLTAALAPRDPLRETIRVWGAAWPLSSVGMKQVSPTAVDALLEHPGLSRVYIDRVIAHRDSSRLAHERSRELVLAAVGRAAAQSAAWLGPAAIAVANPPHPSP